MAPVVVQVVLVGEGHQQSVGAELEVDAVGAVVLVCFDRAVGEPQVGLEPGPLRGRRAAAPHADHELHEDRVEGRADVERAVATQHPLERLADHARPGDRRRLGRDDPAGVDLGGAPTGLAGIDDRDVGPVPAQVVGADQSRRLRRR